MSLACNNLLYHLAAEYMDTLIYSGSIKKDFNPSSSFDLCDLPNYDDEEEEINDTLYLLESEMLSILFLKNRKRNLDAEDLAPPSKRPRTYDAKNNTLLILQPVKDQS